MGRSAGSDLFYYLQDHNGVCPTDLTVFANAPLVKQPSGSEYEQPEWGSFYYVSGLTTNDANMPWIIYSSENKQAPGGTIGLLGGGGMWVSSDVVQRLIREPWEITWYGGDSLDEQTKEKLKKQVKVLPPIGDASAR